MLVRARRGVGGMRAELLLLLLQLLLLRPQECECDGEATEGSGEEGGENDSDDDSDSAPFMIVVEHLLGDAAISADSGGGGGAGAWRCSGSLVSLRTGVTSAECARGPHPSSDRVELWAVAAAAAAGQAARADGARRVSRVASAGGTDPDHPERGLGADSLDPFAWSSALLDLAVLELEAPFGSGARARPILMATAPHECDASAVCHVVRSLPGRARSGGAHAAHARLRIVDATLGGEQACALQLSYWPALRERALCLTGPELCQREWGAGVVCGGKLCGVVSRSAGGAHSPDPHCGDTHAAQSVARWRRFLHCAHTLRACGRGSCANLCSERRLLEEREAGAKPAVEAGAETGAGSGAGAEAEAGAETTTRDEEDSSPPAEAPPPPDSVPHTAPPRAHSHSYNIDLAHLEVSPRTHHDHTDSFRNETGTWSAAPPTRVRLLGRVQTQTNRVRIPQHARASLARKPTRSSHAPTRPAPAPLTPPLAPRTSSSPRAPDDLAYDVPPPRGKMAAPAPAPGPPGNYSGSRKQLSPPRPAPLPAPPLEAPTSLSSMRRTPLFEPNRPDFRAGEYGDNAAEYGAPLDDGIIGGGGGGGAAPFTTTTTTAKHRGAPPPRPAKPATTSTTTRRTTKKERVAPRVLAAASPPPKPAIPKPLKVQLKSNASVSQMHSVVTQFISILLLLYLYF